MNRSPLLFAALLLSCGPATKPTGKFDASKSTITLDKTSAVADDVEQISVTLKTFDEDGAPYDISSATLSLTGEGNSFSQPAGGTSTGSVSGSVRSKKAEEKTLSVTVKDGDTDVALSQTHTVTFVPGPVESIRFTTEPSDVQVGAAMNPPVVVTAFDRYDNVAPGETLLISLRVTGTGVPNLDGGVGTTDGGVVVFDALSFDGPGTNLGMQARCQGCSQPWASDATTSFNVTP